MGSVVMGRSSGVSSRYSAMARALDWRFFPLSRTSLGLPVMYGQTEAGPRMGYLPPERAVEKCGAMGIPIPGGRCSAPSRPTRLP